MPLPIESILNDIVNAAAAHHRLVIQAPPGAGKTTLVPIALLNHNSFAGKILLIQPRRLAVYGAANRMAAMQQQTLGDTIGYSTRFDQKHSPNTRIHVITEGIFLRMIQEDPELTGVDMVIFDEFHERSVTNDLGLAFALEAQQVFRDEQPLKILVMSATLNGAQLSQWLAAPLLQSEGRQFPVTTDYRPTPANTPIEAHIANLIVAGLQPNQPQGQNSVLVFLPGMKEINRVQDALKNKSLPKNTLVYPLHASLPPEKQQQAIAPCPQDHAKIVLTTNVAETSVTIEGIHTVIDSGLVRVAKYDERRGMNVLVTEKISAASAEQRRGRAGRLAEGTCYRAWSELDQQQLQAFSAPEITRTDLLPIALELAIWGCQDVQQLMLLTLPDVAALARAQTLLQEMDALQTNGTITPTGKKLAQLGIHPRLARLLVADNPNDIPSAAAATAAILSEGDPLRFHQQWPQADLALRLSLWQDTKTIGELHRGTWERIKKLTRQLLQRAQLRWQPTTLSTTAAALLLAQGFPDHIAQLRSGSAHRYRLANGKGAQLNPEDRLAGTPYLIVLDASGNDKEPFIRLACPLMESQLETALKHHCRQISVVRWNKNHQRVEALDEITFAALTLSSQPTQSPDPEAIAECLLTEIEKQSLAVLPWTPEARCLKNRVQWLHQIDPEQWPDWQDQQLQRDLALWLKPYLAGISSLSGLQQLNLTQLLSDYLGWDRLGDLEKNAPTQWRLPTGSLRDIHYDLENGPTLSARMQELYGISEHPKLAGKIPLLIEIRSPADRPIQRTKDLPSFWTGSYQEVAKEMRGRYPKHYWPEHPQSASATNKTKRYM